MTPDELRSRRFSGSIHGYRKSDVDRFLSEVASEFERVHSLNAELRSDLLRLEAEAAAVRAMQQEFRDLTAQLRNGTERVIEQTKGGVAALAVQGDLERRTIIARARKEAALILRDAERRGRAALDAAQTRVERLSHDISVLHARRAALAARLRALLASQQAFIEALLDGSETDLDIRPTPGQGETSGTLGTETLQAIIASLEHSTNRQVP